MLLDFARDVVILGREQRGFILSQAQYTQCVWVDHCARGKGEERKGSEAQKSAEERTTFGVRRLEVGRICDFCFYTGLAMAILGQDTTNSDARLHIIYTAKHWNRETWRTEYETTIYKNFGTNLQFEESLRGAPTAGPTIVSAFTARLKPSTGEDSNTRRLDNAEMAVTPGDPRDKNEAMMTSAGEGVRPFLTVPPRNGINT